VLILVGYFAIAVLVIIGPLVGLMVWQLIWTRKARLELIAVLKDFQNRLMRLENRLELRSTVPPMSIFLEPIDRKWHEVDDLCRLIDQWMMQHNFQRIGYFRIEELDNDELCVYLSGDKLLVGSIRLSQDAAEPFVEFCFDLGQGDRGGTSNPPSSTIRPAAGAAGCHYDECLSSDPDLLQRMYDRARELVDEYKPLPVSADRIAEFFEEAHASEMKLRVANGGISATEIQDVLLRQGVEPTSTRVAGIQGQWQSAIEDYLLEFSARGKNRQMDGQRVLIVHDGSVSSYLITMLRPVILSTTQDVNEIESLCVELEQMLERFSPREAVARFRPLLPMKNRFELVDQITRPLAADVYALKV
jgi:hypothetical protein